MSCPKPNLLVIPMLNQQEFYIQLLLSMYVTTILRYKSPHNALVSRNLTEQITRFVKDHSSRHEVTGKYTLSLQSYINLVMPEIKVCFTPAAVHRYESRRRAYNDVKPERAEIVRRNCVNSATANRKKRVCVVHAGLCLCL